MIQLILYGLNREVPKIMIFIYFFWQNIQFYLEMHQIMDEKRDTVDR